MTHLIKLAGSIVSLVIVLILVTNARNEFEKVEDAIRNGSHVQNFDGTTKAEKARDRVHVEQAAPEVVTYRKEFAKIASYARPVADRCVDKRVREEYPPTVGKALIWDATANSPSEAHGILPPETRVMDPMDPCMVFMITSRKRTFVDNYQKVSRYSVFPIGGEATDFKAYNVDCEVCVVSLPDRAPLGKFTFHTAPPSRIDLFGSETEVEGDWQLDIATWVESVVRGPEWRLSEAKRKHREQFPATPKGQDGFISKAEKAQTAIETCKKLGARKPSFALPSKAMLWTYWPQHQIDRLNAGQEKLPESLRASPNDETLLAFLCISQDRLSKRGSEGEVKFQNVQKVAVIALPDGKAIGCFTIRGRHATARDLNPSYDDELVEWVQMFMKEPGKTAAVSF